MRTNPEFPMLREMEEATESRSPMENLLSSPARIVAPTSPTLDALLVQKRTRKTREELLHEEVGVCNCGFSDCEAAGISGKKRIRAELAAAQDSGHPDHPDFDQSLWEIQA